MLGPGFMSGSIDFWNDTHRREDYGVFCIYMLAEFYDMQNGLSLVMSRETKKSLKEELFLRNKPTLDTLEFPLNFERFTKSKTVDNVSD